MAENNAHGADTYKESPVTLKYSYDSEVNAAYIYLPDISEGRASDTHMCEDLPDTVGGV